MLLLQTQLSSAQIGLDWNRLRGDDTSGLQNQTGDAAGQINFQGILFDIIKQLQNGQSGDGDPPPYTPDEEDGNVTVVPVTVLVTEDGEDENPGSNFPPGFENLAYVKASCWNQTMQMFTDFQAQKQYAKKSMYKFVYKVNDFFLLFSLF